MQKSWCVSVGYRLVALFTGLLISSRAASLTGLVDESFHPDFNYGAVMQMALQSDGKVVVWGMFDTVNGTPRKNLARLNSDGSLDNSFDAGAISTAWVLPTIAIAPDGKIVLASTLTNIAPGLKSRVIRLNQNGSIDTSFKTDSAAPTESSIYALAIQPDGAIVLAGDYLFRLRPDGSTDTSFKGGSLSTGWIYSLGLQTDAKILVGSSIGAMRLNADGSLDSVFAGAARPGGWVNRVLALPDGRSLMARQFEYQSDVQGPTVLRLNADGSADNSFAVARGQAAFVLSDNKQRIYVSGSAKGEYGYLERFNPDGSRDNSFDASAGQDDARVDAAAIQSDGKILVASSSQTIDGVSLGAVARLFESNATSVIYFPQTNMVTIESATNLSIPVVRAGNLERAASVSLRIESATAQQGTHFTVADNHVDFAPGERSHNIVVQLIDDHTPTVPSARTFRMALSETTGDAVLNPIASAVSVSIIDADWVTTLEFQTNHFTVSEGLTWANLVVLRPGAFPFNGDVLVDFNSEDGSARAGVDYTATAGTLRFSGYNSPRGMVNQLSIFVPILDNSVIDGSRNFRVNLSNWRIAPWSAPYQNYYLPLRVTAAPGAITTAEVTILDNELSPETRTLHVNASGALSAAAIGSGRWIVENSINLRDWTAIYTNGPAAPLNYNFKAQSAAEFYRAKMSP